MRYGVDFMNEEKLICKLLNSVDKEYLDIVKPILEHNEFIKRKEYHHHEDESVYYHSLCVSIFAYKFAKKYNLNYKDAAIGGLLHDFYYEDWQTNNIKVKNIFKKHGFIHASEAVENSYRYFPELMNDRVENIIKRHMFPLNITPPRFKESWVVTMADKRCSLSVLKHPLSWPKYLGIKKKV